MIRIEQISAVGGEVQILMVDAAVYGPKSREEAVPGGRTVLKRLRAVFVVVGLELIQKWR